MAPHSSTLAWRIPGMGEPGGLLSMGSHRVGHDWSDLAAAAAREKVGGGINQEAGIRARVWVEINMYTLLYRKLVINKDLLYSTRNFIQHCVKIYMGDN